MIKQLLCTIIFLTCVLAGSAQVKELGNSSAPAAKFGKIELSEFKIKPQGRDSAAAAIKLFDKGDLRFEVNKAGSFRYVFVKHSRILILKKDAYDLANIEIGLYKSSSRSEETLVSFNAVTYNQENGSITSQKIGKDAKFSDRFDKNTTIRKFTLPNIKEGSIIEFKYEIRSDFIFTLRDWAFQSSIPILKSEFTVVIPEYLQYKKITKGFVPVKKESKVIAQSFNAVISNEIGPSERIAFNCNSELTTYVAENVPALKEEAFITTLDDYTSKVEFELNSTQFPNDVYKSYTATWDKIVSNLNDDENFGGILKNSGYLRTLTSGIIKAEKDPLKKLELIYSYVQKNLKYNGTDSKYSSETSAKNIIENKAGNAADINLILVNMLGLAGLKSYPILLSTRSNGAHPGHPMITKFNYVIAGVRIDSSKFILDGTNLNLAPNMLGFDCLNHQGLALNMTDKTAEWIPLEMNNPSQNLLTYRLKLSPENVFTGRVYERKTELEGLSVRQAFKASPNQEEYLKTYRKNRNGLKISDYSIKNIDSLSLPVAVEYAASIEDMVEEAGNLVYFTPLLYERTKENPFKLEERKFPVDFGYKTDEAYRIIIELPANMSVEKLPKNEMIKLADESAYFSYLVAADGNTISIVSKIHLGKSVYEPDAYFDLKELFKKIVSKQAEQIVLKKI